MNHDAFSIIQMIPSNAAFAIGPTNQSIRPWNTLPAIGAIVSIRRPKNACSGGNNSFSGSTSGVKNDFHTGIATFLKKSPIGFRIGSIASPRNAPILSPKNPPKTPPTRGANGPKTGTNSAVTAVVPIAAPIPPPAATFNLSPAASLDPNANTPDSAPAPTGDLKNLPILPSNLPPPPGFIGLPFTPGLTP